MTWRRRIRLAWWLEALSLDRKESRTKRINPGFRVIEPHFVVSQKEIP